MHKPQPGEKVKVQYMSDLPDDPTVDPLIPHNARVWNYWLGGIDNFPADREVGDRIMAMFPNIVDVARADRHFLSRVVTYLAKQGIRQFLDIGTGLPTANNTHEIAQRITPEARIVYVDNDPLVLAQAHALLTSTPEGITDYVDADAHNPETILREAQRTLDFTQPVAVMMLGILNFILDDADAYATVNRLVDAVPSGSYLAITHPTLEMGGEVNKAAMAFWNANATPPIVARSRRQILPFFDRLDLLEPGLVSCTQWRPVPPVIRQRPPAPVAQYGAVGRKP
jgi:hypothetical protein